MCVCVCVCVSWLHHHTQSLFSLLDEVSSQVLKSPKKLLNKKNGKRNCKDKFSAMKFGRHHCACCECRVDGLFGSGYTLLVGFPGDWIHLPMQETQVQSLSQEDPLEKERATHSSILPWEIPGQRCLVGYSPWSHKRVRHDLGTKQQQCAFGAFVDSMK